MIADTLLPWCSYRHASRVSALDPRSTPPLPLGGGGVIYKGFQTMPKTLASKLGKAAFDRTKKGKATKASRPKADTRTPTKKFDDFVAKEMRSGAPRAQAIERAMKATNRRLRGG